MNEGNERAGVGEPKRKVAPKRAILVAVAVSAVLVAAAGCAGALAARWMDSPAAASHGDFAGEAESQAGGDETAGATEEAHEHSWAAVYQLRDVPAVTHVEHHDAAYGTETVYETVCNECGDIITGATRGHSKATGHSSFTTDVPIVNEVVTQEAYDETVVDTPATVELVHTADRCSSCGEENDIEDVVVQSMDGSSDVAQ